jgi:hypothetical protein
MAWPTPQEYNEAIQNPRTAFADAELLAGEPELTPLGLPRPITGAFASVYKLACPNQRTFAVRCFLREFGDAQDRYAAISAHLAQVQLPYMVHFTYLADGIRVNRRWYPVLKMEWVDGIPLHTYIAANLQNPVALLTLAEQWVKMAQSLREAGIGHGDLQHGNVLVVNGQLRLIDYDGMYVPALAGRSSHEIGHRNYQHPERTEHEFGPEIDHFSTWVVYTSLVALSVEPGLWKTHQGGDESLLFRREDFDQPAASRLLNSLRSAADPRLSSLADIFATLPAMAPDQIPSIDAQPVPATAGGRPVPGWLRDYVAPAPVVTAAPPASNGNASTAPPSTIPPSAPPTAPAQPAAPSWLLDFLGPQQVPPADFRSDPAQSRTIVAALSVLTVLAWVATAAAGITVALPALTTLAALLGGAGYLAYTYRQDPSVVAARSVRASLGELNRQVRKVETQLGQQERSRTQLERVHGRHQEGLQRSLQEAAASEKTALAKQDQKLQQSLTALQQRRATLQRGEGEEVKRLEQQHAARLAALDQQIARLRSAEVDELQKTLAQRQEQFVASYLKRQTIAAAVIAGIGPGVKESLRKAGIVRAVDVDSRRLAVVPGIGDGRQNVLLEWRRKVEALARQAAPQSLSKIEEALIRGRYYQRRRKVEQEKGREQQKLAGRIATARKRVVDAVKAVDRQEPALREEHRQRQEEIRKRFRERRARLQAELADIEQQATESRAEIERKAHTIQQELARLSWQRTNLERQMDRYVELDFGNYVRRVLLNAS